MSVNKLWHLCHLFFFLVFNANQLLVQSFFFIFHLQPSQTTPLPHKNVLAQPANVFFRRNVQSTKHEQTPFHEKQHFWSPKINICGRDTPTRYLKLYTKLFRNNSLCNLKFKYLSIGVSFL